MGPVEVYHCCVSNDPQKSQLKTTDTCDLTTVPVCQESGLSLRACLCLKVTLKDAGCSLIQAVQKEDWFPSALTDVAGFGAPWAVGLSASVPSWLLAESPFSLAIEGSP